MKRVAVSWGDASKAEPYRAALRAVGLEPVDNPESLDGLDGVLLAGGTDVDPQLYGEQPRPETQDPDTERDARERRLVEEAMQADKPVLGICRGLQMINVALGGTLEQHVDGHTVRTPKDPSRDVHRVEIEPESRLASMIGVEPKRVNSRHHQAVKTLAPDLRVAARARDGVVEAIEHTGKRFAVAVQWHAEDRLNDPRDVALFAAFAKAVEETP